MQERSRSILKNYFVTGHIPTQVEFYELLDSYLNTVDDPIGVTSAGGIGIGSESLPATVGVKGLLTKALSGTVNVDPQVNPRIVNGSGTLFQQELEVGDPLRIGTGVYTVAAINSESSLTINSDAGATSNQGIFGRGDLLLLQSQDGQDRFVVTDLGLVGLGTSTPSAELEVAGKVLAQEIESSGSLKAATLEGDGSAISNLNASQFGGTLNLSALPDIPGQKITGPVFSKTDFSETLTGTISSAGTAVTGTSTLFTQELEAGMKIRAAGQEYTIAAIADNTHLSLTSAPSPALSNASAEYPGLAFKVSDLANNSILTADGKGNINIALNAPATDVHINGKLDATEINSSGKITANLLDVPTIESPLTLKQSFTQSLQGSVALSNASATLSGNQTQFTAELQEGSKLLIQANIYSVLSIESDSSLTLTQAATTTAAGLTAYKQSHLLSVESDPQHQYFRIDDRGNAFFTPPSINGQVNVDGKFTATELYGDASNLSNINPDNFSKPINPTQLGPIPGSQISGPLQAKAEFTSGPQGTISSLGTAVTGVGTQFVQDLKVGMSLQAGNQVLQVASITDETNLVLATAPNPDLSNETFEIPSAAIEVRDVNNNLLFTVDELGAVRVGAEGSTPDLLVNGHLKAATLEGDGSALSQLDAAQLNGTLAESVIPDISGLKIKGPLFPQAEFLGPLTGTVSSNGTALTGASTLFTQQLRVGMKIQVDGQVLEVSSITDNNNLILAQAANPDFNNATAKFPSFPFGIRDIDNNPIFLADGMGSIRIGDGGPTTNLSVNGDVQANNLSSNGKLSAQRLAVQEVESPMRVLQSFSSPLQGTVSLTNASAILSGNQTQFTAVLEVGFKLMIEGNVYEVATIDSDTSLTLTQAATADVNGVTAYRESQLFTVSTDQQNQHFLIDAKGNAHFTPAQGTGEVRVAGTLNASEIHGNGSNITHINPDNFSKPIEAAQLGAIPSTQITGPLNSRAVFKNNISGTISTVGTAVTGTATLFTQELVVGQSILAAGQILRVASITDDTNLVLQNPTSPDLTDEAAQVSTQVFTAEDVNGLPLFSIDEKGDVKVGETGSNQNLSVGGRINATELELSNHIKAEKSTLGTIQGSVNVQQLSNIPITGTVSANQGDRTLTGTGTQFYGDLAPLTTIEIDGQTNMVQSIESNTSLTLRAPAASTFTNLELLSVGDFASWKNWRGTEYFSMDKFGNVLFYPNSGYGSVHVSGSLISGDFRGDGSNIHSLKASNISGTLSDAQIAGLDAAKLTGTVADNQIAGIDAAKITGTIGNSQIANLDATKLTGTVADSQIAGLSSSKLTGDIPTALINQVNGLAVEGPRSTSSPGFTQLTGIVSSVGGSPVLSGGSTLFLQEVKPGDLINLGSGDYRVLSVESDTSLTFTSNVTQGEDLISAAVATPQIISRDSNNNRNLILTHDGKLGINQDVPSSELEVNGLVKATEFEGDGAKLTNLAPAAINGRLADAQMSSEIQARMNQLENTVANALQSQGLFELHYSRVQRTNWYNHYSYNFSPGNGTCIVLLSWYFELDYGTPYNLFFKVNDQNTWTNPTAPRFGTQYFTVDNPSKIQFGCTGGTNPIGPAIFNVLSPPSS